jgi:hypothetical protein
MATIRIAIDNIQNKTADNKTLNTVAELLRKQGHTVTTHGVGPNKIQRTMQNKSNKCDIMIQIAGGKCLGTLVDFYKGCGKYYYASRGAFLYFKCWAPDWKAKRAHDDNFSRESDLKPYTGKTLPEIYSQMKDKLNYGYGTTAEELVQTFTKNLTGQDTNNTDGEDSGTSILELIKQVSSDLDPYGPELQLIGDTVQIKRSNPNTATPLPRHCIVDGQITFKDYDNSTPNEYEGYHDTFLIQRYGVIPLDGVNSVWKDQVLLMAQRGHGHTIELKVILNKNFLCGRWVKLTLPNLGIEDRPYFITKHSYEGDKQMSLTLEPGPPSLYVEVEPVEEDTSTEDDADGEE